MTADTRPGTLATTPLDEVLPAPVRAPHDARRLDDEELRVGGHFAYDALKRGLDIIVSIVALLVAAPVLLAVAIAILVDSGWPVMYSARRVGQGGREIGTLKFRTMRRDSDAVMLELLQDPIRGDEFRRTFKLREDPRCTRVGRVLRKTSLDEFPQFWNVLRGEMSIVGPRPVVAEELVLYRAVPGGHEAYLAVKPGITGLWQVSGRSNTTYEERIRLDIEYVRSRSIAGDIDIIARTPGAVVSGHGAY